jgi:hypothetical protein
VAIGTLGIAAVWLARPERGGDTGPLQTGTEALARCLRDLDLFECTGQGLIDPFPLLQHLPDLVAHAIGLSYDDRAYLLGVLSGIAVVGALAAAWVALRRAGCPEWRFGLVVVAATGPPLAYGNTTWGEMPATALVTGVVAAALIPARPWLVGLAAFGAGVTKETGYLFVAALGLVGLLLASRRTGEPIRRHLAFGAIGLGLALAAGSALNLVRFGTPRNAYYLDPALRTTSLDRFLELAAGLFVAPNGGIVVFWPLASLAAVLLLAVPVADLLGHRSPRRDAWPVLVLLGVIGGLTVGLATWWAPFGWWAWGPRLSLPWVLPILLVALAAYGPRLTPAAARVLTPVPALVATAVVAVLVALPHVGLLWRPQTIGDFFFRAETAVCPGGGPPPTRAYYDCLREQMWARDPIVLDALRGLGTPGGVVTALLVSLVVVGSLVLLRADLTAAISTRRAR